MSEIWSIILVFVLSYLAGAIPFGLLVVWIFNGKDLRGIESGRTGGTNAMRAAGLLAGILTAGLDVLKGFSTSWIVAWLLPGTTWVNVMAALMAILGHNYSIFLIEQKIGGGIRLRGGAGGAPAFGGAMALWPQIGLIIFPLAFLTYIFIGYASVTTMSIGFFAGLIFLVRAYLGLSPWNYALYGLAALLIVMFALRPNLVRLKNGTERPVGLRAYLQRRSEKIKSVKAVLAPISDRKVHTAERKASEARPSRQRQSSGI